MTGRSRAASDSSSLLWRDFDSMNVGKCEARRVAGSTATVLVVFAFDSHWKKKLNTLDELSLKNK